jgi:hypothetical protein
MTPPEAPQETAGGSNLLAALMGTGGGASGVGIAVVAWESFKTDKCADVLMAQQASYAELLKTMIEHLAR